MLINQLTILAPSAESITLGSLTFNSDGSVTGFTLDDAVFDPAPLIIVKRHTSMITGGTALQQHRDVRMVTVKGTILATTQSAANAARRQLIRVLGDFNGALLQLQYTPESTALVLYAVADGAPQFQSIGTTAYSYSATFVCADPVAYTVAPQTVSLAVGGSTNLTNNGDATVYPTITVVGPATGTATGITLGNTAAGKSLALSPLTLAAGQSLVVITKPGLESIKVAGVSVMGTRSTASRFWGLLSGVNAITVGSVGTAPVSASANFNDGWIS